MKKYFPYIIIAVLSVCLLFSMTNKKVEVRERHTTDTLTINRIDTFKAEIETFVYDTIIRTIYIPNNSNNGLELPITQRYYKSDMYECWISGYKPVLDSLNTFNRTTERVITKEVVRNVYPKKTLLYFDIGATVIDRKVSPNFGLSLKFKNDMILGAKVGYYEKSPYYGLNLGFRLNK